MSGDVGLAAGIRAELEGLIRSGAWPVGARVPTEHALMERYGCARMTVHKALSSLAEHGLIVRRRRAGSFVASPPAERAVLAIADFAADAARQGRAYRHEITRRAVVTGAAGGFAAGERLVSVSCRHVFDDVPMAFEERLIRVGAVPAVARARFVAEPPGPWLLRHVPWSEAEHDISAANADAAMAAVLAIGTGDAVLRLRRRTWHQGSMVTDVTFTFPGTRYSLTGRFSSN